MVYLRAPEWVSQIFTFRIGLWAACLEGRVSRQSFRGLQRLRFRKPVAQWNECIDASCDLGIRCDMLKPVLRCLPIHRIWTLPQCLVYVLILQRCLSLESQIRQLAGVFDSNAVPS